MCARRVHRDMVGPSYIIDVLPSAGLHIQRGRGGSAQGKNNKTRFFVVVVASSVSSGLKGLILIGSLSGDHHANAEGHSSVG